MESYCGGFSCTDTKEPCERWGAETSWASILFNVVWGSDLHWQGRRMSWGRDCHMDWERGRAGWSGTGTAGKLEMAILNDGDGSGSKKVLVVSDRS